MYNKNYLSKRPFMVITCTFKPVPGAQTQLAGWTERQGWNVHEEITIVDRVTKKQLTYGTVIVDLLEAKVVTNNIQNTTRAEVLTHYMTKYKDQIKSALGFWMEGKAQSVAEDQIAAEDKLAAESQVVAE